MVRFGRYLDCVFLFSFLLADLGCGSGGGSGSQPPPATPDFILGLTPSTVVVTAGSNAQFQVSLAAQNGFTGPAAVTVSGLPSGVTMSPASGFSVSAGNAQTVTLTAGASVSAQTTSLQVMATSGSLSHAGTLPLTVNAVPKPDFTLNLTPSSLNLLPGTQGSFKVSAQPSGGFADPVAVQITGLPANVTVSPAGQFLLAPSQSQTVSIGISSQASSGSYTLSVSGRSGLTSHSVSEGLSVTGEQSLPSRADFVRTDDSPGDIAYDKTHKRIYETNPVAGTVDVISSATYQILRRIPVGQPAGIDISPDDSTVFIGTQTEAVYAMDTASMSITARYLAPNIAPFTYPVLPQAPVAAPDGTALISILNAIVKWDPKTGQTTTVVANPPIGFGYGLAAPMGRSAGHSKVILSSYLSTSNVFVFDENTNTFSPPVQFNGFAYSVAANPTGTQFAVAWTDSQTLAQWITILDASLNTVATISGGASLRYSLDGSRLYLSAYYGNSVPEIGQMDTTTFNTVAMSPLYASSEGNRAPPLQVSIPLAVDETGRIFGTADHGVAIDDASDVRAFTGAEVYPIYDLFVEPDNGPIGQQKSAQILTQSYTTAPRVWFGPMRGGATAGGSYLSVSAPAISQPGPVNVRFEDADGVQAWIPQGYSYGPMLSPGPDIAAPSSGGLKVPLYGYGLGSNEINSNDWGADTSVTVSGVPATVQSAYSGPQLPGYPFPLWQVTIQLPQTSPGAGDIALKDDSGSTSLPGVYHSLNMATYAIDGTPNGMVYDSTRQQLYIAVGDHIDVFSSQSKSIASKIQIPTINNLKQLGGLAMTPDGKSLIAANWGDASVVVIDPDNPSSAKVVAVGIPPSQSPWGQGPTQLAATNTDLVFIGLGAAQNTIVASGAMRTKLQSAGTATLPEPTVWDLDLSAMSASPDAHVGPSMAPYMAATGDGSHVCFMGQYEPLAVYDSATSTFRGGGWMGTGASQCALNGSVVAANLGGSAGVDIANLNGQHVSSGSLVDYQRYGAATQPWSVAVDLTGALIYGLYNNNIVLFDAHTGEARENIYTPALDLFFDGSLALDATGQNIYAFTSGRLTTIQMDSLPLAVGSISTSGATWTITGTGFMSGTVASIDGEPVIAEMTDASHLTLQNAPALGGAHTLTLLNPDGHTYTYDAAYLR